MGKHFRPACPSRRDGYGGGPPNSSEAATAAGRGRPPLVVSAPSRPLRSGDAHFAAGLATAPTDSPDLSGARESRRALRAAGRTGAHPRLVAAPRATARWTRSRPGVSRRRPQRPPESENLFWQSKQYQPGGLRSVSRGVPERAVPAVGGAAARTGSGPGARPGRPCRTGLEELPRRRQGEDWRRPRAGRNFPRTGSTRM